MKRHKKTRDEKRAERVLKFRFAEKPMVAELIAQGHADAPDLAQVARATLNYGQDWYYAQHKQVAYSKEGAEKFLLAVISLGKPAAPDGANGTEAPIAGRVASLESSFDSTEALAGPSSPAAPEFETNIEPAGKNGAGEFRVTATMLNPSQVYANDAQGNQRRVIVGNSANFLPGMKLRAVPHPTHPGFFLLDGPLPRYKGRW